MSTDPNQEAIDELNATLQQLTDATAGIIQLVETMADRFDAIADDPAQVRAAAATVRERANEIAAAIVAHTPAE